MRYLIKSIIIIKEDLTIKISLLGFEWLKLQTFITKLLFCAMIYFNHNPLYRLF